MPSGWKSNEGILGYLSKLSFLINWNINRKTTSESLNEKLNPFKTIARENVLFDQSAKRYNIFYNRSGKGFGVNLGFWDRSSAQLNQNGFEAMESKKYESLLRWNLNRKVQALLDINHTSRINDSDFLQSRNFNLRGYAYKPEIIWQPTLNLRFGLNYQLKKTINLLEEGNDESSDINEFGGLFTWSNALKGSFNSEITFITIDFTGEPNTYLGYTLLDGLQPGNNLRMNLNWQQNLKNGLQLTLQYFGRKSNNEEMIHSGTVQLTAFF
jgi:hypothetical protein